LSGDAYSYELKSNSAPCGSVPKLLWFCSAILCAKFKYGYVPV